jgi:hypothetical protein
MTGGADADEARAQAQDLSAFCFVCTIHAAAPVREAHTSLDRQPTSRLENVDSHDPATVDLRSVSQVQWKLIRATE